MSLLDQLPHTVSHLRKKYTRDEYMGSITGEESLATGVRAWVQNANQQEIDEFQKTDQLITHKVYYLAEPTLRPGDLIRVTAGPSFVGRDFNFESITDRSAGLGRLWKCVVNEERNVPKTFSGE